MIQEASLHRPTIAHALLTAAPTIRPAVVNALWPRLRADAWVKALRPTPATPILNSPPIRSTTPPVRGPEPRWEVIEGTEALYAYASRSQSRIGRGLRVILYRHEHDRVLRDCEPLARIEFRRALHLAVCERPFYRDPSQPTGWRRNYRDEHLTERAVAVLDLLAAAAHVELLTPEVEDALLS